MCLVSRDWLQGAHCPWGHTVLLPTGVGWTMENALGHCELNPFGSSGSLSDKMTKLSLCY